MSIERWPARSDLAPQLISQEPREPAVSPRQPLMQTVPAQAALDPPTPAIASSVEVY